MESIPFSCSFYELFVVFLKMYKEGQRRDEVHAITKYFCYHKVDIWMIVTENCIEMFL